MVKLRTFIAATLIGLTIYSCAWLDQREHQQIIEGYEVGWNDLETNRCISKPIAGCDGCYDIVIESYVYSVGHNDHFIIAKQHPNLDSTITHYFVVDIIKNKENNKKGIYGPLDKDKFEGLLNQLKISTMNFDIHFPERL